MPGTGGTRQPLGVREGRTGPLFGLSEGSGARPAFPSHDTGNPWDGAMKVKSGGGKEITTLSDWEEWFKSRRDPQQWKEGRSAYSLAEFIITRDGASHLESVLATVLATRVVLDTATPEMAAKFDSYRNPAQLDLGINGHTAEGQSLFVGVEAKVDEPFCDQTVGAYYQTALIDRNMGRGTRVPERIRGLVSLHAPGRIDEALRSIGPIRYQLLTGTAGTVSMGKAISVFLVLVFRTSLYDEVKGEENRQDYREFIERVHGRAVSGISSGVVAHEVVVGGRPLICIYEDIERF